MYRVGSLFIGVVAFFCVSLIPTAAAAEPTNSGLLISPPRHSVQVAAGGSDSQEITIANYTGRPLNVTLSVQEFSVANLSYEYQIRDAEKPWVHIEQTDLRLESSASQTLKFTVRPPHNATPGGKYYLIVASAVAKNGDLVSTMQVAAPIYITVSGDLDRSSKLEKDHGIDNFVVFGDRVPFHLNVTNTGNVHYLIEIKGKLEGLFTSQTTSSTQHILLPNTTRQFTSSIPTPFLPGIYRATYGYTSEATGDVIIRTWVVYLPPWSVISGGLALWLTLTVIRFVRKRRATDSRQSQYK